MQRTLRWAEQGLREGVPKVWYPIIFMTRGLPELDVPRPLRCTTANGAVGAVI